MQKKSQNLPSAESSHVHQQASVMQVVISGLNTIQSPFLNNEWPCPQHCGRSFKHKHTLSKHLNNECREQPQFTCKNCTRTFKRKHHLKKHTMSCDNIQPEFSCPFCGRLFKEKWNLKLHLGCVHKTGNV
ncbi:hypothetical protein ACI65C_001775 [Semiaphis heraclei]